MVPPRKKRFNAKPGIKSAGGKPAHHKHVSKPSDTSTKAKNKSGPKAAQQKPPADPSTALADPYDQRAQIPFDLTSDTILLVGEGDLSFTRALVETHCPPSVTATTFDSLPDLEAKYPSTLRGNMDAIKAADEATVLLHGIDATRLARLKPLRGRRFDRVVFNFPHVGGKSTDVNRQVRANQELLVGFFAAATPLLADGGTVVVTLFDGEPYSLWNVRDLARHRGLEVLRSFRFEAALWPGYSHARTLGEIVGGGGWKGEEREARSYVFGRKGEGEARKRKRDESDDD